MPLGAAETSGIRGSEGWATGTEVTTAGGAVSPWMAIESLVALAYLVIFGTIVAWSAYTWLLKHASIQQVVSYAFVNPIVALGLGVLLRGEPLSPSVVAAALLVALAVGLVVRSTSEGASPGGAAD